MRVVAISDTHGQHERVKLPTGDILIHAGDACSSGTEQEFTKFVTWFRMQPFERKIFVAGNHDRFVESHREAAVDALGADVDYLQDTLLEINRLRIYGSPWCPEFCNWAFNLNEESRAHAWELIPVGLDILITHTPSWGSQDYCQPEGHVGCRPLERKLSQLTAIEEQPLYHIFGHIHEGYGISYRGRVSANVSQCDGRYNLVNPPVVFNI